MDDMNSAVAKMREKQVDAIGIYTVSGVRDYLAGVRKSTGEETELAIKGINCIYYELLNGGFICLRPSGTEPKLKVYYSIKAKDKAHAEKALGELKENFSAMLEG